MQIQRGIYRHYKGGIYKLVAVAKLEATEEDMAVYHSVYQGLERGEGGWFTRPLKEFLEEVEYKGQTLPRFKFIST